MSIFSIELGVLSIAALITQALDATAFAIGIVMAIAWLVSGLGAAARRKWGWVAVTVASLNPIVWIANVPYGVRRWREFQTEAIGTATDALPRSAR